MGTSINYRLVKCPNDIMKKLNAMADQHTTGPGWGNGYVSVGPEHSLFGVSYDVLSTINVLMGRCEHIPELTVSKSDMFGVNNTWTFGFDTMPRFGKIVDHNTLESVGKDVTLLKYALVNYVNLKAWATKYIATNIITMTGEDVADLLLHLSREIITSATDIDHIHNADGMEPSISRTLLLILLLRNGIFDENASELDEMWKYTLGKLRLFKDLSEYGVTSVNEFNRVIEYSLEKYLQITRNPLMENCDD